MRHRSGLVECVSPYMEALGSGAQAGWMSEDGEGEALRALEKRWGRRKSAKKTAFPPALLQRPQRFSSALALVSRRPRSPHDHLIEGRAVQPPPAHRHPANAGGIRD